MRFIRSFVKLNRSYMEIYEKEAFQKFEASISKMLYFPHIFASNSDFPTSAQDVSNSCNSLSIFQPYTLV